MRLNLETDKRRGIIILLVLLVGLSMFPLVSATSQSTSGAAITWGQIIATTIVVMIAVFEFLGIRPIGIMEPVVIGPIVGYIIGIPQVAVVLSAMLQLVYLGIYAIGGAAAPDMLVATVSAVFFAKILGYTTIDTSHLSSLVALAVPIGILSMYLEVVIARTGCTFYAHWADKEIGKGHIGKLGMIVTLGTLQWAIAKVIPVIVFGALGASPSAVDTIRNFVNNHTVSTVLGALGVAGAMMPAIGLAYLMKLMFNRSMIAWFTLGYILAAYLKMPILGVALTVSAIALAVKSEELKGAFQGVEESEKAQGKSILSSSDLKLAYLKTLFTCQWAWNYERMQGQAYAFVLSHIEKKLRKNREDLVNWMKVHNEFFNTNPVMIPLVVGLDASLEEKGADQEMIRSLKAMLMGPLAGLGDGFFWFTIRPIAYGLAASIMMGGSPVGMIVGIAIWGVTVLLASWKLLDFGYKYGERILGMIQSGNFKTIREVGTMLAIGVIGALGVTYINIHTPVTITLTHGSVFKLQNALDKIMPKLLPLATLLGTYILYRKGLSPAKVLGIVFIIGFILGLVGFLAT